MSLSLRNSPTPKITKAVEEDVLSLYSLYEYEEYQNAERAMCEVWKEAQRIFQNEKRDTPYFLIFMMRPVSERCQTLICTFAICPYTKDRGDRIQDSLVWYCDKPKGVFKLATDLCDLRRRDGLL